jgi:hypothetical protein
MNIISTKPKRFPNPGDLNTSRAPWKSLPLSPTDSETVNLRDVVEALNCDVTAVFKAVDSGDLQPTQISALSASTFHQLQFLRSDLDAFIATGKIERI